MSCDKKLTKGSEAVKHLRSLFESKTISRSEDPKAVYAISSLFQFHKLSNFRTCYNRLRKEFQSGSAGATNPSDILLPRFSAAEPDVKGSKRRFSTIESESEEGDDSSSESAVGGNTKTFKPAYLLAPWIEPGILQKRLTISILLPAGTEAGMFKCRVDPSSRKVFEVSVVWPQLLVNVEIMHRKWLTSTGPDRIQAYHPKLLAFQAALKELRRQCGDDVVSTGRTALLYAVETHVYAKYNLAWRENATRMIYVELKASMDSYGHLNDQEDFEVV